MSLTGFNRYRREQAKVTEKKPVISEKVEEVKNEVKTENLETSTKVVHKKTTSKK